MKDADDRTLRDYARRCLPLEGGRNFRDLGGYRGANGRTVRWGVLFRSGSMAALSEADLAHLATLGIRTICDLRSTGEREMMPIPPALCDGRSYWCRDYPTSFADLRKLMGTGLESVEAAREAMLAGYRRIPFDMAPAYAEVFRRLVAGEVPLVFNCSAGKDRAGMAAALVLSALGVSRADVMADYALTVHAGVANAFAAHPPAGGGGSIARKAMAEAVYACEPAYAEAAFEAIDTRHGSMDGYLHDVLGVGKAERAALRALLLA